MSKITKVKGVSPNYMQFFWRNIVAFREAQTQGDYATSIKLAATLIDYLPEDFKDKFQERAERIIESLNLISSQNLQVIQQIADPFKRHIYTSKLLNTYSFQALNGFINEMSAMLEEKGYLEMKSYVPEGSDLTWQPPELAS